MNYKGAKRLSAAIDWAGMYQDYLASGLSMRKYYFECFVDFCQRCGICDHVLSRTTMEIHLKRERDRILAEEQKAEELETIASPDDNGSSAPQSIDVKESSAESGSQVETQSQVLSETIRVCDLGTIISDARSSTVTPPSIAPDLSVPPPTARIQFIPPRCLITEFKGMKFTFACHDPIKTLTALISQLNNQKDGRHAY